MIKHPRHAALWLRDRLTRKSPLELSLPWLAWPCIDFLNGLDLRGQRVFEYGGGGSTLYFLRRGCRVRTVENSRVWSDRIEEAARPAAARLDMVVVEMPEHPEASDRALALTYVNQIKVGSPWNLILVDGVDGSPSVRMECLSAARSAIAPGGLILLDDSWRPEYDAALTIMSGFARRQFLGLGPARLGVTRTDMYS